MSFKLNPQKDQDSGGVAKSYSKIFFLFSLWKKQIVQLEQINQINQINRNN